MASAQPRMELSGISKSFPGIRALSGVNIAFGRGQIHALLGENGAGKSTLLKIMSGAQMPDAGDIRVDGRPVVLADPRMASALGISMVNQELSIVPQLSLASNVAVAKERRRLGVIDRAYSRQQAVLCMAMLGFGGSVDTQAGRCSVATQQIAEIARALYRDQPIVMLDEPTASLGPNEVDGLLNTLRRLRDDGRTIVYISHRLSEVLQLEADEVTVLRDGEVSGRFNWTDGYSEDDLVRAMVGRSVEVVPLPVRAHGDEVLSVRDVRLSEESEPLSFSVRAGEIVGIAGMVGSGRTEMARAIAGADPAWSGDICVDGKVVNPRRPRDAIRAGIALLTEDRKSQGLALQMTIAENVTLPHPPSWAGVLRRRRRDDLTRGAIARVGLKREPGTMVGTLSGGNQQRAVLARWLLTKSRVFLFDEPTRGVDIAAKQEIYALIEKLAEGGAGVIVISSELVEVIALSDRVLVMRQGSLVNEYQRGMATEESIIRDAARSVNGSR